MEFYDCYEALFADALELLRWTWLAKLKAMKTCRSQLKNLKGKNQMALLSEYKYQTTGIRTMMTLPSCDSDKLCENSICKTSTFKVKAMNLAEINENTLENESQFF